MDAAAVAANGQSENGVENLVRNVCLFVHMCVNANAGREMKQYVVVVEQSWKREKGKDTGRRRANKCRSKAQPSIFQRTNERTNDRTVPYGEHTEQYFLRFIRLPNR